MPSVTHLVAFALISLAIILAPGPSVLFVISRSLTLGRLAGVATATGNATGVFVQVVAVAFGIGSIVERSILAFTVIKLAGAAYLVYLGVQALRHRRSLTAALAVAAEPKTIRRIVRDGFAVGVANPKTIVFFAAILTQFVDPSAGQVPTQMLLLGAIFFGIAVVCDSGWAMAAGTARSWLARSPRRLELIGGAGGLTMIGLGAGLALTGRRD